MFKSPLMLVMIVNNGGNKLFLMCKCISNKGSVAKISQIKGHKFIGVYPSPVLIKLGARKCIILSCLCIKLKDKAVFLCLSDFNCYSNQMACN